MTTLRLTSARLGALALSALLASACGESIGVGATGEVSISFQRVDPDQPAAQDSQSTDSSAAQAVPEDTVSSLEVTVIAIQFLRVGGDSGDGEAWTSLELSAPIQLDLMALPIEGQSALVIASGQVEAGSYTAVRLFVTNPRITFEGDVQLGLGVTFQGGVEYAVTIPSGAQTGIKTDASFTVRAGADGSAAADVGLLFDAGSSFANVTATGTGQVMLAPVIRARGS